MRWMASIIAATPALIAAAVATVGSSDGIPGGPIACESLRELKIENTTLTVAERIAAGSFAPPGAREAVIDLPAFCRVVGETRPTPDSRIAFEVWMPLDRWNGSLAGVGNGGWAGAITYRSPRPGYSLVDQVRRGYAAVSTNTGHEGEPGLNQAKFAFDHPERLVDFGYRAVHESTLKAKAIARAFYGRPPRHSYWFGCSTGGKQGLMEAQRFPGDYDGIVAGAPANNWPPLMAATLELTLAAIGDSQRYLTPAALKLLGDGAIAACDKDDGVTDGVIGQPDRCRFDPETVQCPATGDAGKTCLTPGQVTAAKRIYQGVIDPTTRRTLYPGLAPGSEPFWGAFANPSNPFPIPLSYYRWLVFADAAWEWQSYDFSRPADYRAFVESDRRLAPVLSAVNPDLRAFRARGGKLIQFHGWSDQLIAARNSIDYYESVVSFESRARGDRAAAIRQVQRFYRLFMVPGMAHCAGGPGPGTFDMQAAIENWVERGTAPASIIATRAAPPAPERTRPLCPYPQVAVYDGRGDVDNAASFTCREHS